MKVFIKGEEPFKVLQDTLTIGATTGGFTFAYGTSKDSVFTEYDEATPAGEVCIVNGVTPYSWAKLVGNTDEEVEVIL